MLRAPTLVFLLILSALLISARAQTSTTASLRQQADAFFLQKKYPQALAAEQKCAQLGDSHCQRVMGVIYKDGNDGVTQNYAQALFWLQKAAAQGDSISENYLGAMYQNGLGVAVDYAQARAWFQKAAAKGNPSAIQALAQMTGGTQPAQSGTAQGNCAAVYITSSRDDTYGTHEYFGAAWRFTSYNDALAAASAELARRAAGIDPNRLPGGQYGPSPAQGSGCNYAHGAVAGKLKVAPGGSSMFNASGAAGTGPMGPGIYDIIEASFADSTDAAISAAMSRCQTENGPGENDREVCTVLSQW